MEALIDKIAFLALPSNFATIFPYCFWYWCIFTVILIYILRNK